MLPVLISRCQALRLRPDVHLCSHSLCPGCHCTWPWSDMGLLVHNRGEALLGSVEKSFATLSRVCSMGSNDVFASMSPGIPAIYPRIPAAIEVGALHVVSLQTSWQSARMRQKSQRPCERKMWGLIYK